MIELLTHPVTVELPVLIEYEFGSEGVQIVGEIPGKLSAEQLTNALAEIEAIEAKRTANANLEDALARRAE